MAQQTFLQISQWNGRKVSGKERAKMWSVLQQSKINFVAKDVTNLGILDMSRGKKNQKKTAILLLNWIIVFIAFYTMAANITKLCGNIYVNSIILSLADLPGLALIGVTLKYFPRRLNLFMCQFIVGMCCTILSFWSKENEVVVVSLYMFVMVFSSGSMVLLYLITGELYATNLRNQAVGTCATTASIFGMIAPFVSKLAAIWNPLPMLFLGVPSIAIALLVYFLPETKHAHLPQTMTEAEYII